MKGLGSKAVCVEPPFNSAVQAARQWRQAKGEQPKIECGCGLAAPIRFLFRCLYCGVWFCQTCAEEHFGKTRAQHIAERVAKLHPGPAGPGDLLT